MGLGLAAVAVLAILVLRTGAGNPDVSQCSTGNGASTCALWGQLEFPLAQNFSSSSTFTVIGNSSDAVLMLPRATIALGK
jgi:hypothetical protein